MRWLVSRLTLNEAVKFCLDLKFSLECISRKFDQLLEIILSVRVAEAVYPNNFQIDGEISTDSETVGWFVPSSLHLT